MSAESVPARPSGVYISQVARVLGVSPSVVRGWESEGLVTPMRSASGYRVFSVDDLERLRRVRDLILVEGLNAAGARRVLETRPDPNPERTAEQPSRAHVADRIQMLRRSRGVSLRALASAAQLSTSSLSAIERGVSAPSVGTLQRLAAAMDVTVPKLLGTPLGDKELVVRRHERRRLDMEVPGVRFENLYAVDTVLQSMLVTIEPGQGTPESYSHDGEEFLYVMRGRLEVVLDELDTYVLGPGDAMTFASTRPHRWHNPGDVPTVSVWVNTPPTF